MVESHTSLCCLNVMCYLGEVCFKSKLMRNLDQGCYGINLDVM
jgi:hypothetical protein